MSNTSRKAPSNSQRSRTRGKGIFHGSDESLESSVGRRITPMPNGCWAWNLDLTTYGSFAMSTRGGLSKQIVRAHRYVYETLEAPIPDGHHLHHKCENPGCVNPDHLEPLTPADHAAAHVELRQSLVSH